MYSIESYPSHILSDGDWEQSYQPLGVVKSFAFKEKCQIFGPFSIYMPRCFQEGLSRSVLANEKDSRLDWNEFAGSVVKNDGGSIL